MNSAGRALALAGAAVCAVLFVDLGFALHDLNRCGWASLNAGRASITDFLVNSHCHNTRPFTKYICTEQVRALIRRILRGFSHAVQSSLSVRECNLLTNQPNAAQCAIQRPGVVTCVNSLRDLPHFVAKFNTRRDTRSQAVA